MCGIAGYLNFKRKIEDSEIIAMRDAMRHRGPDDDGVAFFENASIAFGHRRLSFLDLSPAGRQPMCNEDETVWVILNGEIYNYVELRAELEKRHHLFKTHTDTETIIHGYEEWGDDVVNHLKGMFAFGLLDLKKRKLFLARDRFGIKPLYYHQDDSCFVFGSELKALLKCSEVKREIDFSSFADYFTYRYVPSPKTIWKNISKLPPAHYLVFDYAERKTEITEYWKLSFSNDNEDDLKLAAEVGEKVSQSVAIHARSDVPVGSFLSGGYDSSAVVYYLTRHGYKPDVFSIGFKGWYDSEDQYAKIVADLLGVPLTVTMEDDESLDLLQIMPDVYDEPLADISILPTWLVSHAAVKKVKAVMSGEGADELFGGYTWQKDFVAMHNRLPRLKKLYYRLTGTLPFDTVEFYAGAMAMGRFDASELKKLLAPDLHSHIAEDTEWFYRKYFDQSLSPLKSIQLMDIKCFMGEQVLTKIDRASMANSLEVRVPFLDHELFERVLQVKESVYFKPGITKFLLHENVRHFLPEKILQRPKQGFVGPDDFYMNMTRYKTIVENSRMVGDGIVQREYCTRLLQAKDHWRLWKLAVMEKWYSRWG